MKSEIVWNGVSVVAVLALVLAAFFFAFDPAKEPTTALPKGSASSEAALDRARKASEVAKQKIEDKEWTQDSKAFGGLVVSQLSVLAEKKSVTVNDLRFDKPITVLGLEEAPFTVAVAGEFNHVTAYIDALESSNSKLGLSLVQISSSDQGQGLVKATLRLTAFVKERA